MIGTVRWGEAELNRNGGLAPFPGIHTTGPAPAGVLSPYLRPGHGGAILLVPSPGLEPGTWPLEGACSTPLSYEGAHCGSRCSRPGTASVIMPALS